jgi:SAM-dependent methyltransferase
MSVTERILGSPRLYDRVQKTFGLDELRRTVAPALARLEPGVLIDVGAGTANFYPIVPGGIEYVAVDVDQRKLELAAEKFPGIRTVHASGTRLPFDDSAVDHALCVDVSHHLLDGELDDLVSELARVTRTKLVFVDALRVSRLASRLLWKIDRGSHPRPLDSVRAALGRRFVLDELDVFTIHHTYVMIVARPLRDGDAPTGSTE